VSIFLNHAVLQEPGGDLLHVYFLPTNSQRLYDGQTLRLPLTAFKVTFHIQL